MKTYIVDTFKFIGKLSDVSLFLDYALSAMEDPSVQTKALSKWMEGVPDLVRDERFINKTAFSEKELEAFAIRTEESMKESYLQKFRMASISTLNLSLVMLCTVLELFFEHIFALIFRANPKTLLAFSKDKNITVEQLLNSSSYEDVLDTFIQKTTGHIIRQGTKDTIKAFNDIGIKIDDIFNWDNFTEDVQKLFNSWDENKLIDILNERHSIVHDNALPIKTVEDLLIRKDFFTKIILNISQIAWYKYYKYGVILDAHDQIRTSIKASGGDPSTYPPPPKKE